MKYGQLQYYNFVSFRERGRRHFKKKKEREGVRKQQRSSSGKNVEIEGIAGK